MSIEEIKEDKREMTMAEAIAVARRTLAEHYRLVLIDGYHNGQ